jgi:hypothetical protein
VCSSDFIVIEPYNNPSETDKKYILMKIPEFEKNFCYVEKINKSLTLDEIHKLISINTNNKIEKEARMSTSLVAPLSPPTNADDMESVVNSGMSSDSPLMSNSLEPAEKISGGGGCGCGGAPAMRYGGSLMGALSRTAYTLAPAAILLATAASVMRGKTRKHKNGRKQTRRHRRRYKN